VPPQVEQGHELDRAEPNRPDGDSVESRIERRVLAETPSLLPLVPKLAMAAAYDVTVLLTGETGTGKTFLARLIHDVSPRSASRFLVVPCGAVAGALTESEFFGHVRGAFTGADRETPGKFAAAGRGSLLLDEVDTLGLDQQAKLLRLVETGEYEPVGGTETRRSACRVFAASNRDLDREVAAGRFRQDLFYRMNALTIHLPPLRERAADVALLARDKAADFTARFGKELSGICPEAMAALERYSWPGNIRELENTLLQAVLNSRGPLVLVDHLPDAVRERSGPVPSSPTLVRGREAHERALIQKALVRHNYCRTAAARGLGVSRVTLHKKLKRYGLVDVPSGTGLSARQRADE
jgi:two-component system, NtrC family, response regulator HydG